MRNEMTSTNRSKLRIGRLALLGACLFMASTAAAAEPQALLPWEFSRVAERGLGDLHNSAAWSMKWWKGKLYIGTVRDWYCWIQAWSAKSFPLITYPPNDDAYTCAPDPRDLPLQAEIWRYTPETDTWDMLYRSPLVPIPDSPGKFTANELGYRTMTVFVEPDGTEALYVGGATPNLLFPPMPPPRILRSTDGDTFEAVPHDPGTLLGDLGQDQATFRDMEVYDGRMFVINGKIQGDGELLEASNPAGGNDNFRWVTPEGMRVFEMATYNGYLYVGTAERGKGYSVVKTRAVGPPPYDYIPIVTHGAFLKPLPSNAVVSMFVFKNRLYVGANRPAELIRINPDDSWDLVLGSPRYTPDGLKRPVSGLGAGFDWRLNNHIWRMEDQEGVLYVGTADDTTRWRRIPQLGPVISSRAGFDLFSTTDGHYFTPITVNGFDEVFQQGIRTFASSPVGLFFGAVNLAEGVGIYQGVKGVAAASTIPDPPGHVEIEGVNRLPLLSWEPSVDAVRYRVFRADVATGFGFQEIGVTDTSFFVDGSVGRFGSHNYFVVGEGAAGAFSGPSNMVRFPSKASTVTFFNLTLKLIKWRIRIGLILQMRRAVSLVKAGELAMAAQSLDQLRLAVINDPDLDPWRAEDFAILLGKLARRVRLAELGIVAVEDLFR